MPMPTGITRDLDSKRFFSTAPVIFDRYVCGSIGGGTRRSPVAFSAVRFWHLLRATVQSSEPMCLA